MANAQCEHLVNKYEFTHVLSWSVITIVSLVIFGSISIHQRLLFREDQFKQGQACLSVMIPTQQRQSNATAYHMQEQLLDACETGDSTVVKKLLDSDVDFNVNCTDFLGRSPLQIAVDKENTETIELLISKSSISNIEATLLHAINESKEAIACNIIQHERYAERINPIKKRLGTQRGVFQNDCTETSGFYLDTTPLTLASQLELYTVVKLLVMQGSRIVQPHAHDCACTVCLNRYKSDYMRYAHRRLNAYRGLTSACYITLCSADPFAEAFRCKREVLRQASAEKYFKAEYVALANKLSEFLVKLIDNIRGTRELDLVLNRVDGWRDDKFFEPLARLRLAVARNEKKFVTHPSCQMKLNWLWFSNARFLQRASWFKLIAILFVFVLSYPPAAVFYNFFPCIETLSVLDSPAMKFMAHTYSFILFIAFIIFRSFTFSNGSYEMFNCSMLEPQLYSSFFKLSEDANDIFTRNLHFSICDYLIAIWVAGMLWRECRQIYDMGASEHLTRCTVYQAIDTVLIFMYITAFSLQAVVIVKGTRAMEFFKKEHNMETLLSGNDQWSRYNDTIEHWYYLNEDRFLWDPFDPKLISEILFATANILSFARISYVLAVSEYLGPLQISLARMSTDIARFVVLFMVLFVAFMIGIDNLLWPFYSGNRNQTQLAPHNTEHNKPMQAGENFGFIMTTFRSIFWLTFGLSDYEIIDMSPYKLFITQNAAYILLGAHIFCIVIVMLNMLIAMMSRSYEQIQTEADTEFKFARSRLYLDCCDDRSYLPVPLNLIPGVKVLRHVIELIASCWDDTPPPDTDESVEEESVADMVESAEPRWSVNVLYDEHEMVTYFKTIKTIVKRFIADVTKKRDDDNENNARQDILMLKRELTSYVHEMRSVRNSMLDELAGIDSTLVTVRQRQDEMLHLLVIGASSFKSKSINAR